MLSITDYLLIKLQEECVELAAAAISMNNEDSPSNQKDMSGELNDVVGVLAMLPLAGIKPDSEVLFTDSPDSNKVVEDEILSAITNASLHVAKMASKCLVFGLKETYVGSTLHNTQRLYSDIQRLATSMDVLVEKYKEINYSHVAQVKKRAKMLKYIPISLQHSTISESTFNEFANIVRKLDS